MRAAPSYLQSVFQIESVKTPHPHGALYPRVGRPELDGAYGTDDWVKISRPGR
jgi:hypothetical protein